MPVSLILDALARAERDKRREAEPLAAMIADEDRTPATNPANRRPSLLAIAILLAAILIALATWYVREPEPAGDSAPSDDVAASPRAPSAAQTAAQAMPAAPAPDVAPRSDVPAAGASVPSGNAPGTGRDARRMDAAEMALPAPGTTARIREQRMASSEVQSLYDAAAQDDALARAGAAAGTLGGRDTATADAGAPAPAEAAARVSQEAADATDAGEEPVELERLLREVQRTANAVGLAPHPAPLLEELSQQFRDDVPTLMYLRHDYNPAGTSTVLLNGETLAVGGRSRGVELMEILPDSIVCRFQGTEFRLRALNSWVNL